MVNDKYEDKSKFKSINDIEKSIDKAVSYDSEPLSAHDREVIKQFLIDKYLK